MSVTIHYINGKLMTEIDFNERMPCKTCNGGKDFDSKEYFKPDELAPDHEEMMCLSCLTKYKKLRLSPNKIVFGMDTDELIKNIDEQTKEIKMVNPEEIKAIAEGHDEFTKTGECKNHIWKKSNPVITSEGTYVFEACVICRRGRIEYHGKFYEDDLNVLVNWVVSNGLAKEKKREKEMEELGKIDVKADLSFEDLFEDEDPSDNIFFV